MNLNLKDKALDCLELAALPVGSEARLFKLRELATRYSMKAVETKLQELVDRGYIEALRQGSAVGGLTPKGAAALEAHTGFQVQQAVQAVHYGDLTEH